MIPFSIAVLLTLAPGSEAKGPVKDVARVFLADAWDKGWMRASGSWVAGKQELKAYPLFSEQEAVDLNCYKDMGICIEATAQLSSLGLLMARTEVYEIQSWGPQQIQTKSTPEPCGSFQITIDRKAQKVFSTKTNDSTRNALCKAPGTVELLELKTR